MTSLLRDTDSFVGIYNSVRVGIRQSKTTADRTLRLCSIADRFVSKAASLASSCEFIEAASACRAMYDRELLYKYERTLFSPYSLDLSDAGVIGAVLAPWRRSDQVPKNTFRDNHMHMFDAVFMLARLVPASEKLTGLWIAIMREIGLVEINMDDYSDDDTEDVIGNAERTAVAKVKEYLIELGQSKDVRMFLSAPSQVAAKNE